MTRANNEIWKPEEYLAYHKLVFRIMFDFLNSNFPPHDDHEWWKNLSIATEEASRQAKGGKLTDGILLAICDYLEEEYKKRKEQT